MNEVFKAYLGGGQWGAAAKTSKATLRAMRHTKPHMADAKNFSKPGAKARSADYDAYRGNQNEAHEVFRRLKAGEPIHIPKHGAATHLVGDNATLGPHTAAAAFHSGGRKGRRIILTNKDAASGPEAMDPVRVTRHEIEHLSPKRSSYRMHQIHQNPEKAMKEEARADHKAGLGAYREGHVTGSGYAGAAEDKHQARMQRLVNSGDSNRAAMFKEPALQGYRDVQHRMHTAQGGLSKEPDAGVPQRSQPSGQSNAKLSQRKKIAIVTAGGAGVAGGEVALHRRRTKQNLQQRRVSKGFNPWDGIRSTVSKMSPDPSSVHIQTSGSRRGRLRPIRRSSRTTG